jgi:1,4-dihydroxy-2-naphthoate octaprenyltransferase
MQTINAFLKLVEIRTKVASMFPLLLGTLMAYHALQSVDGINLLLMFVSLLCIDLTTTGLNHYFDYKRAYLKTGYHYEAHNPVSSGEFSPGKALILLVILAVVGMISGLILVYRTDLVVLMFGALAFAVGICYSTGPLPLSRTILGELFSGLFMGGLIPFLAFYIHLPANYLWSIKIDEGTLFMSLNFLKIAPLIFASLPMVLFIGNIMLANNICDSEEDIVNKRYTLPISIGRLNSLRLYQLNVVVAYSIVIGSVIIKVMPVGYLLTLIALPTLYKQTRMFVSNPKKSETFKLSVKNFIVFSSLSLIGLFMAYVWQ